MQVIPYSDEMERALIVSVLQDPNILPKISSIVEADDFYKHAHKEIWKIIEGIEPDNLDSITVQDKLREESRTYFKELVEDADRILPSASNAIFYAETVKDKSKLRAGIDLGQQIIATCYQETDAEEAIHNLEEMFARFLQKRVLENSATSSRASFKQFVESLGERKPEDPNAVKTGFTDLDLMTQRMEGLIVLAARPSMGKTALALNIIANVAKKDQKVCFFSLEQDEGQVFERMLASESGVPLELIRIGAFKDDSDMVQRLEESTEKMLSLMEHIHVDDTAGVPTSYISSVARQKNYEWGGLDLIVVDYLHIMRLNEKANKVDALGQATSELRSLGKELGCPVLLLCQLKRPDDQSRDKNRRPDLTDLRSSGEIEQNADMVWFIWRESYHEEAGLAPDNDVAEIIVRKNRNGRQGIEELEWLPTIVKFRDIRRR